jgi:hypothetical protein
MVSLAQSSITNHEFLDGLTYAIILPPKRRELD